MLKCNVKKMKRFLAMLLAVIVTITSVPLSGSVQAAESKDVKSYVNDLILYYRDYQEKAATDIDRVLAEMRAVDAGQADAWEKIMDYWSYVNSEGFVNVDTVPEGLPTDNSVAVVILGFALNSDGTMKEELVNRLQTGLNIANAYPNSYVVVTGGGTASDNPNVTEGGLMGEWLLEQGLEKSRLIVENRAPDTVGNAKYTYEILKTEYPQVENVVLVTSDYHVPRGCVLYYSKFVLDALSTGQEPLTIISNAGCNTGSTGYETIALQSRGIASVAGISVSGSVELSQLSSLKIVQNTMYQTGNDLDITVEAEYNTGFSRNVTDSVTITGFDPAQSEEQVITVSYTENGTTMEGSFALTESEKTIVNTNYLSELITKAEAVVSGNYTKASYEAFAAVLQSTKDTLNKDGLTKEEMEAAYDQLNTAMNKLRPRINVAAYYKNFTADSDTGYVMELDGFYKLEEVSAAGYEVTVSEDNVNWTSAITDINVKYMKFTGSGTLQASQIYAYGEEADNLIIGKDIYSSGADQSASSSSGATDFKAVDGDRSTYWDAGAYSLRPWIIVDLGGTYQLDKVNVINYWSRNDRYYHFEVYTSIDGELYTLVGGKDTDSKANVYGDTVDLSDQTVYASYIKVVGTYNSKNSAFHINELRAYGTPADRDSALIFEARRALESLVNEYEPKYEAKDYTEASFGAYNKALEAAKALLTDENSSYETLREANVTLTSTVEALRYAVDDTKKEGTFRVASFNIKSKAYPDTAAIRYEMFERYAVDFAGMQEVDKNTTRNPYDVLASFIDETYMDSSFQKSIDYQGGEYGNGILSTLEIKEKAGNQYAVKGSEGRSWQKVIVEVDGKEVALYNTHFALEYEVRVENLMELLEVMENDPTEYKILTGDFNSTWESMYPFLEDYNIANGKDGNWICTTTDEWTGEDLVTDSHAIDNIITTRNIEVTNITVIDPNNLSDHMMIYADCRLLDEAVVSTEYLDIVIADAEAIDREGIYTEVSYYVFTEALKAAKAIDEDTATQEAVNTAIKNLQSAMNRLDRIIDNVALDKEVVGSEGAEYVTDGDIFTEWSSETLTDSVVIDLEDIYELDELKVVSTPKQAGTYGVKYDVYVSTDNETFTKVAGKESDDNVTSKGITYLFDEAVTARYIKIQFTYATSEDVRLSEVEAYGSVNNLFYKELLQSKIDSCLEVNESLYTSETVNLLKEAAESAKQVLTGENPSNAELEDAYHALVLAFDSLKPVESGEDDTADNRVRVNLAGYARSITVDSTAAITGNYQDTWALIDGVTTKKYWANNTSDITNGYVIFELPEVVTVDELMIYAYAGYTLNISTSVDGQNYELVKTASIVKTKDTVTLDQAVDARYVKLEATAANPATRKNLVFYEVEIYGYLNNIAVGKEVTVSHLRSDSASYAGQNIVDGTPSNAVYWDTGDMPKAWSELTAEERPYAVINLGDIYVLEAVDVMPYLNSSRYYQYEVYTSTDGTTYSYLGAETGTDQSSFGTVFAAPENTTAQYIKVVGTYNSANPGFHLREVRVTGTLFSETPADYTKVNEAIAKAPEDMTPYTLTSAMNLKAAILAVKENLKADSQAVVDGYATAIENAIAALQYKVYTVAFCTGEGFSNQLVEEVSYKHGDILTAPESKTYQYYLFKGWDVNGDRIVDVKAGDTIEGITEDTTYLAVYSIDPSCWYTVSFTEGSEGRIVSTNTTPDESGAYRADTLVKITAPTVINDGAEKKFAGWYKGDELVSTNASYSFYLKGNMELTAKYTEEEPEAKPAVTFSTLTRIDGYVTSPKKDRATFGITWDVPSGCTVISEGILRVYDGRGTQGDLTLETDNEQVKNQVCSKVGRTGSYTVSCTIGNSLENVDLYVRGYVIYRDKDGAVKTVYTNVETLDANVR